jgi:hypothetical protein
VCTTLSKREGVAAYTTVDAFDPTVTGTGVAEDLSTKNTYAVSPALTSTVAASHSI